MPNLDAFPFIAMTLIAVLLHVAKLHRLISRDATLFSLSQHTADVFSSTLLRHMSIPSVFVAMRLIAVVNIQ
jgi:hypothetical protein